MNRKQFLRNLEAKVQHLDYDVKQDILNEFDVHIRQGVHTGLSEEEVVRSLGNFDEIVDELLDQEEVKSTEEEIHEQDKTANEETNEQLRNRNRKPHVVERQQPRTPSSPSKYLDVDPSTIDKLNFQIENATVVVEAGDKFSMDYQSPNQDSELNYEVEGNKLKFIQTSANNKRFFWLFKKEAKNRLIITWPSDLDSMEIEVEHGAVRVSGLNIDDLHVECDMGSVTGQHINGNHFNLSSDMGRVVLENSKAQTMSLSSDMGQVTLEDCHANVYDVKSDMGRISGNNINPNADGQFHTDMGAIKLSFSEAPTKTQIVATSNMGAVSNPYGEVHDAQYRLTLSTDMGAVSVK